jgi:hypothetical protein
MISPEVGRAGQTAASTEPLHAAQPGYQIAEIVFNIYIVENLSLLPDTLGFPSVNPRWSTAHPLGG